VLPRTRASTSIGHNLMLRPNLKSGQRVVLPRGCPDCAARHPGYALTSASLRDFQRSGVPIHADVAGLLGNTLEPGADGRKGREIEAAFVGDMREGVE